MNTYDSQYMLLKEKKLKQIINKEKTAVAVAEELAISRQSVHKWLARYKRYGIGGLIVKKEDRMQKSSQAHRFGGGAIGDTAVQKILERRC